MGKYLNVNSKGESLSPINKASQLIADGATRVTPEFQENLVCVVENRFFDAAAYCETELEFNAFNDPDDHRRKIWLVYEHVAELAN